MFENLKIIGTSHISNQSVRQIKSGFSKFNPDYVAVEIDRKRFLALIYKKNSKPSFKNLKQIGFSGFLFLIIGGYVQKKLGSIVGVEPGSDMKTAINLAKEKNLPLVFIDQDIEITLKRFSKAFTLKEKITLLKEIFFGRKLKLKFDLTKVPDKKTIKTLLNYFKTNYPGIFSVLIDERNKFMAKKLFKFMRDKKEKRILCVVGAGHEEGLKKEMEKYFYSNTSL
ncbi:hypothetical protein CMO90_01940 [Candidatus Woesearchaeota archaeon]|jgi:pheromone shutdown-related protein TraB|nr:hypothetical protein [Candidatus Woesearchaeota archaeon]|tara:strand:+ start:92 stop:766 length:675 start_codon:yes stop_codon:yes gene_type:complete